MEQTSVPEPTWHDTPFTFAQKNVLGFIDGVLESRFQAWYTKVLLNRADTYSLVVCMFTHLIIAGPMLGSFSSGKLATFAWMTSFVYCIMCMYMHIWARPIWLKARRPLVVTRRIISVLVYRQLFLILANARTEPPTTWGDVVKRLLVDSAAIRMAILVAAIPDVFVWSAPYGLLVLFGFSRPTTAALCGDSNLGGNDFSRDAIRSLHKHLMTAPGFFDDPSMSRLSPAGDMWGQQCTHVVHASQIIFGVLLPLLCLYAIEAYCRQLFLRDHFEGLTAGWPAANAFRRSRAGLEHVAAELVKGIVVASSTITVVVAAECLL